VQKNAKPDGGRAGFFAVGECKKEYEILAKFEAMLNDVGRGMENAKDVLDAAKKGHSVTISNPFPKPGRLPI